MPMQPPMDPTAGIPSGVPPMPSDVGGMTGATPPGQEEMATPEQKQSLMDLIDQIRSQLSELHALSFAHSNQSLQQKNDLLKQVYAELQAAGVDLTDPRSVSQFIETLKKKSPDLAKLFEDSMSQLLGAEPPQPDPGHGQMDPGMAPDDMQNPLMGGSPMDMNNGNTPPTGAPQG